MWCKTVTKSVVWLNHVMKFTKLFVRIWWISITLEMLELLVFVRLFTCNYVKTLKNNLKIISFFISYNFDFLITILTSY